MHYQRNQQIRWGTEQEETSCNLTWPSEHYPLTATHTGPPRCEPSQCLLHRTHRSSAGRGDIMDSAQPNLGPHGIRTMEPHPTIDPILGWPAATHTAKLEKGPLPHMKSGSHCPHPMMLPAQSQLCGIFTNSVQAEPHSPLSLPAPQEMAQEATHLDNNTWSSTCRNYWERWESGEHTWDTRSEGDQQPRPRQRVWPIKKSNYSADGHQTCTNPLSTTTPSKSSKVDFTSKTHQNSVHNTPST